MEENITSGDRASLIMMLRSDGFRVLQKIMKQKCDDYITVLINADPANDAEVMAAHRMAKAAAQFYESITLSINNEILMFNADTQKQVPQDATEGVLDIDNHGHGDYKATNEQFGEESF